MNQNRTNTEVWDSLALDLVSIQVEGKIVFINAAGAKMLGAATPGQLVGKPILDFVHPDYREIAAKRARLVTTEGIVLYPNKEVWLRLDGMAIDVEVAAMPYRYEGQRAVQLIVCESEKRKSYRPAHNGRFASRPWRKQY